MDFTTWDNVAIAMAGILAMLSVIVLLWNAVKSIIEWKQAVHKPTDDVLANHEQRITHLETCCSEVTGKLQNDWQWQQDEAEMNRLMLKSIKQLLKHSLDGNDKDGLKAMEDEIDGYLLEHAR